MARKVNYKPAVDSNKQRSINCRKLAKKTVKKLLKNNEKVNINSVARHSKLSRQFFYEEKHKDIREYIERCKESQKEQIKIRINTSNKNKDKLITCLHKEIDGLKEKLDKQDVIIKNLKRENNFLKRLKYED